jgi:uncharacterized protein YndB with AHSA1/START domain
MGKKILLVILALIAIPLIIAIFTKDEYLVEREVTINKPKQDVFNYIKVLRNQEHYSKWVMQDPKVKLTYTGADGAEGSTVAWESEDKHVGQGSQTIRKIVDGDRMDLDIHFIKPFEGNSGAYFTTTASGNNQTTVKWGFNGKRPYMIRVICLFWSMEKSIGKDLQTGLDNLKGVLEKQ